MEEAHLILLLLPKVQTKSNKKWAKPNNLERKTKKKKFFFYLFNKYKTKKKEKVEEINSGQNLKKTRRRRCAHPPKTFWKRTEFKFC